MREKERNIKTARIIASSLFWRAEYFPEEFTLDFPSAPPGMPNHFNVWESERCFEWLNRTVKSWEVELEEFYTTPDPDQFWAIGICRGEVLWGDQNGHFQSKFFMRLETETGRIKYMKGWMDTLAFLRAANLQIPPIIKSVSDPCVDKFLTNTPKCFRGKSKEPAISDSDPYSGLDMSPAAIENRMKITFSKIYVA